METLVKSKILEFPHCEKCNIKPAAYKVTLDWGQLSPPLADLSSEVDTSAVPLWWLVRPFSSRGIFATMQLSCSKLEPPDTWSSKY